jgi:hypothetical protein
MHYNSEIWHLPNLSPKLKQQLLSASASALKLCTHNYEWSVSHLELCEINKRVTPNQLMKYKWQFNYTIFLTAMSYLQICSLSQQQPCIVEQTEIF